MARTYAPLFRSITISNRLADLPNDSSRLFYTWLLTVVDDWGRCTADSRKLNVTVWPMLRKSDKDTEKAIEALRVAGLIAIFQSDDGPFVQIPDHDEKSGSLGKRDHRKASHWPETAILAPLGPDWPGLAPTGPRARARAICSVLVSSGERVQGEGVEGLPFPGEAFAGLWDRWRAFRREIKKPLTATQEKSQLKKLAKETEVAATERVERSIANGWQGLWFQDDKGGGATNGKANGHVQASGAPPGASNVAAYRPWRENV
jgi:hypothetical protein